MIITLVDVSCTRYMYFGEHTLSAQMHQGPSASGGPYNKIRAYFAPSQWIVCTLNEAIGLECRRKTKVSVFAPNLLRQLHHPVSPLPSASDLLHSQEGNLLTPLLREGGPACTSTGIRCLPPHASCFCPPSKGLCPCPHSGADVDWRRWFVILNRWDAW